MKEGERGRGRIVLAIDTGSQTRPALEAAAALAVGLRRELSALFVEDERLLRIAALPFALEIGFPSAHLKPIGLPDMEQAFRVQAETLRRVVEEMARRLTLAWTFDVTRGEILSASLARLGPDDLLVVGKRWFTGFARGGRPSEPESFRALAARPVTVLFDGSQTALRALEIGLAIAEVAGTSLAVLIPAAGREAFRASRERAQRWLAERSAAASYLWLAAGDPAALSRAVRSQGAGALVWASAAVGQVLPALAELLEELGCPVVMLPSERDRAA